MANNKISPLAALNRSEGDKRGVSSLKGYGQPSTIGEFLGGFTGAPRRFSVMDPEAAGMQTARDIGEQASVATSARNWPSCSVFTKTTRVTVFGKF